MAAPLVRLLKFSATSKKDAEGDLFFICPDPCGPMFLYE